VQLKYTSHARKRMLRRHVAEEMIIETIAAPEIEYPSYDTTVALKTYGNRKLGVVYIMEGNFRKIITVCWRG
jgi:hypothetical protein